MVASLFVVAGLICSLCGSFPVCCHWCDLLWSVLLWTCFQLWTFVLLSFGETCSVFLSYFLLLLFFLFSFFFVFVCLFVFETCSAFFFFSNWLVFLCWNLFLPLLKFVLFSSAEIGSSVPCWNLLFSFVGISCFPLLKFAVFLWNLLFSFVRICSVFLCWNMLCFPLLGVFFWGCNFGGVHVPSVHLNATWGLTSLLESVASSFTGKRC